MVKLLYAAVNIIIVLLFLLFCVFVLGVIYGSLEMFPTEEQHEKVRTVYGIIAFIIIVPEFILIKIRSAIKKKLRELTSVGGENGGI